MDIHHHHNYFLGRKPPGQHRHGELPGIDAGEWHDALDAAQNLEPETFAQFIARFDAWSKTVTAFIDAQPAIDAVVAELTSARAEIAALKADKDDAANQTVNLQPLQDIASGIAADVTPAPVVEPAAPAVDANGNPVDVNGNPIPAA